MSITESLSKKRVTELRKARKMDDFRNVWSDDFVLAINSKNKANVFYN